MILESFSRMEQHAVADLMKRCPTARDVDIKSKKMIENIDVFRRKLSCLRPVHLRLHSLHPAVMPKFVSLRCSSLDATTGGGPYGLVKLEVPNCSISRIFHSALAKLFNTGRRRKGICHFFLSGVQLFWASRFIQEKFSEAVLVTPINETREKVFKELRRRRFEDIELQILSNKIAVCILKNGGKPPFQIMLSQR